MRVLVTGATGFVGRELVNVLLAKGYQVSALVRHNSSLPDSVRQVEIKDLAVLIEDNNSHHKKSQQIEADKTSDDSPHEFLLNELLQDIDVVIHLAARVHSMNDESTEPMVAFRQMNTEVTLCLARHAADAGVRRFLFLSTIKVNGEQTNLDAPFSEKDVCKPKGFYSISKREAELGLIDIAQETGIETVIIRPPLIYGPGVKGNFASIMRWIDFGIPLPLGAVKNQRSLLALDNLVDFLTVCITHPDAANQIFLISDGEDVSTPELLKRLAAMMQTKARLLPVPVSWMVVIASLIGKKAIAERLFGSLQINSQKAHDLLGWSPVVSMTEQLNKVANADHLHE